MRVENTVENSSYVEDRLCLQSQCWLQDNSLTGKISLGSRSSNCPRYPDLSGLIECVNNVEISVQEISIIYIYKYLNILLCVVALNLYIRYEERKRVKL